MNYQFTMSNPSGYTLLEVLIVLALVLMLSGMASGAFLSQLAHHRLNGAVRSIVSDLRLARELSLAGGSPVSLVFNFDRETTHFQRDYPDGPVFGFRDFKNPESGYKGVDLVSSTGGKRVSFSHKGTTNTFTTIRISGSAKKERRISVAVTGRVIVR